MALIGQFYFSESADVNALPPSQRLRVYLAFDRTLFSVEAREQEYSCFWKILHNHGDEYEGIFAVRRLFEELKPEEMSGTFLGIPVCNTLAFENLSRETPVYADGLNLAREFPGNPSGSYTQRLADALMSFALRNLRSGADALIDLHSSGTRYEYLPMMGAHLTACFEREKELCRATGFSNLWELNKNPKSLNGAASAAGVVSLGAEVAGRGGARVGDIRIYADALRGLCGYMGIAPYPYTIREGAFLPAHTQKFEHSGLFLSSRELGCMLHQGDQIGVLYDPQCEAMETLTAACDGVLWGIRRHVQMASPDGTCRIFGDPYQDVDLALAARNTIVTCEELVSDEYIRREPDRNSIPGIAVAAVVHVPFGGHPSQVYDLYDYDKEFYLDYDRAGKTDAAFEQFLKEWVYDLEDHESYLNKLGASRLMDLKVVPGIGYHAVVFCYNE